MDFRNSSQNRKAVKSERDGHSQVNSVLPWSWRDFFTFNLLIYFIKGGDSSRLGSHTPTSAKVRQPSMLLIGGGKPFFFRTSVSS